MQTHIDRQTKGHCRGERGREGGWVGEGGMEGASGTVGHHLGVT